jgi:hypothetical protein
MCFFNLILNHLNNYLVKYCAFSSQDNENDTKYIHKIIKWKELI